MLVVEDERDLRELIRRYLERETFSVLTAGSGAEALGMLSNADLVVLDLGLPDIDGLDVLRVAGAVLPVIVLTARSSAQDRIEGLRLGADDYVTKPFSPTELILRIKAVLRRTGNASNSTTRSFQQGRLVIDEAVHEVRLDGDLLPLTVSEWGVLTALASAPRRVFSRLELANRIHGYEFGGYERSIDSHVKNLRHKLGPSGGEMIETVTGVGYRLGLLADE